MLWKKKKKKSEKTAKRAKEGKKINKEIERERDKRAKET